MVGWVWLLVVAFQESPMWGIGLLVAPSLVGWIFAGTHLDKAAIPFGLHFFGGVLVMLAIFFGTEGGFLFGDTAFQNLEDTSMPMLVIDTG